MQNLKLYTDVIHTPLFRDATIVIFIWKNVEGWPVVDVSENLEKLYGYKRQDYIEGKLTFAEQIHPDDYKQVLQEVIDASDDTTESFQHKPYRYLDAQGKYHWVSDHTSIIRDNEGNITHYVGYLTHIDQYVRYNEKLLEKNAYYKELFELVPVGICNNSMNDGSFIDVNSYLHSMCGYTKEEFLNLSYWDITSREYEKEEQTQLLSLQKYGKYGPYQKEYIHKDGHKIPVLLNGIKHVDKNGEEYIWSVIQDISEVTSMYKRLESSELKFRSIFENANDGILIVKENRFIELNQKAADLLNASKEYILHKSPADISPTYQTDGWHSSDKAKKIIEKVLAGENQVFDWQHLDANGKIINIEISLSLLNQENEKLVLCIWRDISERIEMMQTIEKEREKATRATMLKSRFLANMSHEIRTPMNGILGFIDILAKDETDEKKSEIFKHIKNSSNTLMTIINDILDISKIESGKLLVENVPFNANELFDSTAQMYKNLCSSKGITLIYNKGPLPYELVGDSVRIKQVLTNFLSNALKFTDNMGEIVLNVSYDQQRQVLQCSVKDTGIGIQKERLEHIFNDFEQEDSSTTRKYGGTGLGLSISARLIELMNGKILVQSTYKQGSTFSFNIPLVALQEPIQATSDDTSYMTEIKSFNAHVLIVEDNATNQLLLSILLDEFGVSFDIANDGLEALDMVKKSEYDLIFMDENMPNMNGIEATKEIRKMLTSNKNTPIVALTANAITGDKERFLEAGMDDYISKPYDDEDIKKALLKYVYTT